jgi:hypothetical protein
LEPTHLVPIRLVHEVIRNVVPTTAVVGVEALTTPVVCPDEVLADSSDSSVPARFTGSDIGDEWLAIPIGGSGRKWEEVEGSGRK